MKTRRRPAFTLVELLVVIAIIAVMVSMLVPGLEATRETSRRYACTNQLAKVMLAVNNYEMAHELYPSGVIEKIGPIRSEPIGQHHGWIIPLLPYLEEANAYRKIDQAASVYDPKNAAVRQWPQPTLVCPSEFAEPTVGASSYAGVHHDVEAPIDANNSGVFFVNSRLGRDAISDGVAHTLFVGEKLVDPNDLGWMSGTRATLRNTGLPLNPGPPDVGAKPPAAPDPALVVGGFSSHHPAAVNFALGDGSVRFITDGVDQAILQKLANRADGKLVNPP